MEDMVRRGGRTSVEASGWLAFLEHPALDLERFVHLRSVCEESASWSNAGVVRRGCKMLRHAIDRSCRRWKHECTP